jgi:hypothetical protein
MSKRLFIQFLQLVFLISVVAIFSCIDDDLDFDDECVFFVYHDFNDFDPQFGVF